MGYGPHGDLTFEQYQKYLKIGGRPDKPKPRVKPRPLTKTLPGAPIFNPSKGTITSDLPVDRASRAGTPEAIARSRRQRNETMRRQRILRANGYPVVVDGMWGPRSQAAWLKYKRGPGSSVVFKDTPDQDMPLSFSLREDREQQAEKQAQQAMKENVAARELKQKQAAERAEQEKRAADRALILKRAAVLQRNPAAAARLPLSALTAILIDPQANFDPARNRQAALAIQHNLRAKGYRVKLTGQFDQATYSTLKTAFVKVRKQETNKRLAALREQIYSPLNLRPGESLAGFPLDKVPTPRELDRIVQQGGFTATLIAGWYNRQLVTEFDAFSDARLKQLQITAQGLQPFLQSWSKPGGVNILQALGAIYGTQDLAFRTDLSDKDENEQRWALDMRAKDPNVRLANAEAVAALRDQVSALMKSSSPEEFATKMAAYEAVSEVKFKRLQAQLGANEPGFFGKAVDKALSVGEFMRTAAVYNVMEAGQTGLLSPFGINPSGEGVRDIRWEDAAVTLGADPNEMPDYDGLAEAANGISRFGFAVIADPLNFAHPFRAGSSIARLVSGRAYLGAYTRVGTGLWDRAYVYNRGTWSKANALARIPGSKYISEDATFIKMRKLALELSALKEERVKAVATRVTQMGRHGFVRPVVAVAAKGMGMMKAPKNLAQVTATRAQIVQLLEDSEYADMFGALMQEMGDKWLSVYVAAQRDELSNVGASILASTAEMARVTAAHQDATSIAVDMIEKSGYHDLVDAYRKLGPGVEKKAARDNIDRVRQEIIDAYGQAVEGAGSYINGGVADVSQGMSIYRRTTAKMDFIEDVLFPAMQDVMDRKADEAFALAKQAAKEVPEGALRAPAAHPLWDEKGLWVGRTGEAADALRARARASFDEANLIPADNPAWGKGHTAAEANEAMDFELRTAIPRIRNYAAREARANDVDVNAVGDIDGLIAREHKKIKEAWEQRSDGLFYDTREKIMVNPLYGRNFTQAYATRREMMEQMLDPDTGELSQGIDRLALPPSFEAEDEMQEQLWKMMWQFGSRYRKIKGPGSGTLEDGLAVRSARKLRSPKAPEGMTGEEKGIWYEEEYARLGKMSAAFSSHRIALNDAANSVITSELVKEKLYMQALSRAQGRFARASYMVLNGALQVWKFATLPLRPGWVIRNTVDNFAKAMIASVRDPRLIFMGAKNPGAGLMKAYEGVQSIFGIGIAPLRGAIKLMDGLFNTRGLEAFDNLLDQFWDLPADALSKIMGAHGLPSPPPAALDGARFSTQARSWRHSSGGNPYKVTLNDYENAGLEAPKSVLKKEQKRLAKEVAENGTAVDRLYYKMRYEKEDTFWELMADHPESYWKRVIYRAEYKRKAAANYRDPKYLNNLPELGETLQYDAKLDPFIERQILNDLGVEADVEVAVLMPEQVEAWKQVTGFTEQGLAGLYDTDTKLASVFIDGGKLAKVRSRQDLQEILDTATFVTLHEMRHALQANKPYRKLIMDKTMDVWERFRRLPYGAQPHEMDANLWANFKKGKYKGAVDIVDVLHGNKSLKLPSRYDDVAIHADAHAYAWDKVTENLFDYGQVTVAEDSLRLFFPFIQFWRKNTALWVGHLTQKPWLDNAILQFDQARRDSHRDLPGWMQRYIHVDEIVDAAASVPGLAPVIEAMLPDNMQIDPMSFMSFAPLQRAFRNYVYGDNPNLPGEQKGWAIIGPMIDAMNDWGLGMSPFVRKPLEGTGVAASRAWQTIFPQTSLAVALTRQFFQSEKAFRIADWERVFTLGIGKSTSDQLAENFDFYVNQEIAGQVAAGEQPDREKAEATMRTVFYVQQVWGYFGGAYWRRATPEDIYISKLQDDVRNAELDYDNLPAKDKTLLKLWSMRGQSPEAYDRYLELLPMIQAYYRNPDWAERDKMLQENPALTEYIDATPQRKGLGSSWIKNVQRHTDTSRFFIAIELANDIDAPSDVKAVAYDMFATPELREWWKRNDTPAQIKDRMVQGQIQAHMQDLQKAYFKLPPGDFEARDGFLSANPELVHHWNRNNNPSDNYEAIMDAAKADLRNVYFAALEADGFESAAKVLKQFPFMFEGTKSQNKVKNGEWLFGAGGNGKTSWSPERRQAFLKIRPFMRWFFDTHMKKVGEDKAWDWLRKADNPNAKLFLAYIDKYGRNDKSDWSSERRELFLLAKPYMKWFFDVFMPKVGEKKAWAWLESSEGEGAKLLKEYFKKYGKSSQRATDYLKAKPYLLAYEKMPADQKEAWLKGDSEGAKIVREFFDKYSNDKDMSARAKAWLDVKKELDYYGSLPKDKRTAWLDSDDPRAVRVKAFFKKYGKDHQFERAFKKLIAKFPGLKNGTPEQAERLRFWKQFYDLPPDERPAFVHEHAEDAGIFLYGDLSEQYRQDREREYNRRAIGLGISKRAAAFLYVKPLMDFYRTLPSDEKPLFLRANPELQEYFDLYTKKKSLTGDPKLDAQVEQYFKLPANSIQRSEWLRKYPAVQDYFDKKASPAERAIRATLEQYFEIDDPDGRAAFITEHPEVQEYFDRRKEERSLEAAQYDAFDESDPRLAPFYENAQDLVRAGEAQRARLKRNALLRLQPDELTSRRDRQPLAERT